MTKKLEALAVQRTEEQLNSLFMVHRESCRCGCGLYLEPQRGKSRALRYLNHEHRLREHRRRIRVKQLRKNLPDDGVSENLSLMEGKEQ